MGEYTERLAQEKARLARKRRARHLPELERVMAYRRYRKRQVLFPKRKPPELRFRQLSKGILSRNWSGRDQEESLRTVWNKSVVNKLIDTLYSHALRPLSSTTIFIQGPEKEGINALKGVNRLVILAGWAGI
jgi:hypothetical protein